MIFFSVHKTWLEFFEYLGGLGKLLDGELFYFSSDFFEFSRPFLKLCYSCIHMKNWIFLAVVFTWDFKNRSMLYSCKKKRIWMQLYSHEYTTLSIPNYSNQPQRNLLFIGSRKIFRLFYCYPKILGFAI
jgi:hypothetical protein